MGPYQDRTLRAVSASSLALLMRCALLVGEQACNEALCPDCVQTLRQGQARETSKAVRGEVQSAQASASSSAEKVYGAHVSSKCVTCRVMTFRLRHN